MISTLRSSVRFAPAFALVCVCSYSLSQATAADNLRADHQASMTAYTAPDGESYFALGLQVDAQQTPAQPRDHVILFDTSASQNGAYRDRGLAVLSAMLQAMSADDRVCLFAVDVKTKRYTQEFIPATGAKMDSAVNRLSMRTPLGATDMGLAVRTAMEAVSGDRPASITYIGDGLSIADLIGTEVMRSMLGDMREQRIAMHSFAIGPQTDLRLLGVIAQHTGGVVVIDDAKKVESKLYPQQVGESLVAAANAPIYYPTNYSMTPVGARVYPAVLPPLRSDRETILIGKGDIAQKPEIMVTIGDQQKRWTVGNIDQQPGNTFLAALWSQANRDDGLSVPLAGTNLLNVSREAHENHIANLVDLGEHAVATGQMKQADLFAGEIKRLDPANVKAQVIFSTVTNAQKGHRVLKVAQQNDSAPALPAEGEKDQGEVDLLDQQEKLRDVRTERLKSRVNADLEHANDARMTDPGAAISLLKGTLRSVSASTDVDINARESLRARLRTAIQQLSTLKDQRELAQRQDLQRQSQIEAQRRLLDQLAEDEDTLKQLIDQVSVLIYEGYRGDRDAFEKAEAVARAAWELQPYTGVTAQAVFVAEAAGQLDKALRLQYLRYDRFLETLYQVELSHVPFPDEPPIVYPPAEVWEALTINRKKWASVDLKKFSPIEDRIYEALDENTEVDFQDQPLTDVVLYLKDLHNIQIVVDDVALNDEGISPDSPINLTLAGISLRNALKLMLEPLQLTYVVQDEVMKITTKRVAEEILQIRVYPVGDLVIPIQTPQGGGGGFGGGGGGFGGGGGGFGGGGGGFGGGGGGFGGGQFNVPAEDVPAEFDNKAVDAQKKKP